MKQATGLGANGAAVLALLLAAGCQPAPPYDVSKPPPLSEARRGRLARIEVAEAPGGRPRVWVEMPTARGEAGLTGGFVGAMIGVGAGAAVGNANSGDGFLSGIVVGTGAVIGGLVGAAAGGTIGALLGGPAGAEREAAAVQKRAARQADVSAAAVRGAGQSPALAAFTGRGGAHPAPGSGTSYGILSVRVVTYGTRIGDGGTARPFVAVRARLTNAATGRELYRSTRHWHGPSRPFQSWSADGGGALREALDAGAQDLARRSVDAMLAEPGPAGSAQ
jgi:hypothetical protein